MNKKGEINPGALLELFQELGNSIKIVEINFTREAGRQTKLIYKEGNFIYVPLENHRGLEIFLVGEGVLTLEQVGELIKYKKESGMSLEQLIVQADILSEEQLKKVWETIAKDFVLDLFTSESGEYITQELPSYDENNLGIFPLSKLGEYEAEIQQMMESIASLGGYKSVYKITNASYLNVENVSEDCRKQFQSSINGKNTVAEIINWSYFTVSKTLKILNELKAKNSISLAVEEKKPKVEEPIVKEKPQEVKADKDKKDADTSNQNSGNISGSLSVLSLVEVLQSLHNAHRSGVLTLKLKDGPATINLSNGEIVGVIYGDFKNKDAFYKVVPIKQGDFSFEASKGSFEKDMDIPTMNLLMEAMRLNDEGGGVSASDKLGKSDEQPIMSSRVLKRKESKASFFIKAIVLLGIVIFSLVYFFVIKPGQEKEAAFTKQKSEIESLVAAHKYGQAIDKWKKFSVDHQEEHSDWIEDVEKEKNAILTNLKDSVKNLVKEIEKSVRTTEYTKSLDNLRKLEDFITQLDAETQKIFEKEKAFVKSQREIVISQQKELDYSNWKSNLDSNISKVKDLSNEFFNEDALVIIKSIETNVDKDKDKILYESIAELKNIILERESIIKNSQAIIDDKNSSFPSKIEAYEKIINNAGVKQPRGIAANKQLILAKEKMSSFESKLKGILQSHAKDSAETRVKLIEQLQKDVSSKEEDQFLEKEKQKILLMSGESSKLQKSYSELIAKKDFKGAFALARKIFDQYGDSEAANSVRLPFYIEGYKDLNVKVNGSAIEMPYFGEIEFDQIVKVQAEQRGCKPITMSLDKNLKNYEVELIFKKNPVWSVEYKSELEVTPVLCLGGKGIVIANQTDLEMIFLETGNKVWRRQINNSTKPFKKPNGSKVIMGDDEFWKLDSEICVFENYVAIGSKNSEIYVLNAEDGNNLVKYEMNYYSKIAPMIIRSSLLGNKAFAYTGTLDGNLICVAIDDQTVRLQEKLGDTNNSILGIYQLNEHNFVVILEQGVQCFSLSTSKLKWSKNFNGKIKNVYVVDGKIFVRHLDGLMEITETPDAWKLISFPSREVKEILLNGKDLQLIGEDKNYYLDISSNKFISVNMVSSNKRSLYSNSKLYEFSEKTVKCFSSKKPTILWETEPVNGTLKSAKIIGNYLLYSDGAKLHAVLLEN